MNFLRKLFTSKAAVTGVVTFLVATYGAAHGLPGLHELPPIPDVVFMILGALGISTGHSDRQAQPSQQ